MFCLINSPLEFLYLLNFSPITYITCFSEHLLFAEAAFEGQKKAFLLLLSMKNSIIPSAVHLAYS